MEAVVIDEDGIYIMNSFWQNRKVLVTGHTGFKGSWLTLVLHTLGAEVVGYALDPYSDRDNFSLCRLSDKAADIRGDVRDIDKLSSTFKEHKPEIVFHLAAQPLVKRSYGYPKETYETNVMGTLNVLECIKQADYRQTAVIVTSDKCYENMEQVWGYRESDRLGGYDPYSSSKACVEILVSSYRNSFFNINEVEKHGKAIGTVRAGNVIGGGDWSENRIVPDCIRALEENQPIKIRNPKALRPWQYVLEPLYGYLALAEKLHERPKEFSGAYNFGPNADSVKTVWEMAEGIVKRWGFGELLDVCDPKAEHESNLLTLDISKALFELGWKPKMSMEEALDATVEWYKRYKDGDAFRLCISQIANYEKQ